MSAVLCSEPSASRLELRSAALSVMALLLKSTDLSLLADELSQRACAMPGLFDDEPVAVDLSCVRGADAPIDFSALIALLSLHGMRPLAVRGGNPAQMTAAVDAGLLEAPEGARPPLREAVVVAASPVIERVVEVPVVSPIAPLPPLMLDKPLRSGQQVYAQGRDLIVLALVSHGAEVMADGHIHLYAPLRGRAHAGAAGNADARIFCHRLEAQMLAIAGCYRTMDEALPASLVDAPAMVRRHGDALVIEPLG
jgi:septum site-determining protein MinC